MIWRFRQMVLEAKLLEQIKATKNNRTTLICSQLQRAYDKILVLGTSWLYQPCWMDKIKHHRHSQFGLGTHHSVYSYFSCTPKWGQKSSGLSISPVLTCAYLVIYIKLKNTWKIGCLKKKNTYLKCKRIASLLKLLVGWHSCGRAWGPGIKYLT